VALVILALAGQGGAGFFVFRTEQSIAGAGDTLRVLGREARRAQALIGELRGAHAGLVANGQDQALWSRKVTGLVADVGTILKGLDRSRLTTETSQELTAATEALASFDRSNARVLEFLTDDQPLTASSVVFGDAASSLATGASALDAAQVLQARWVDAESARLRRLELEAIGGAAGFTLLVLLLLLPRVSLPAVQEEAAPAARMGLGLTLGGPTPQDLDALGRSGFDLDLKGQGPPPPVAEPPPEPPRESETQIVEDLQRETALGLNTETQVDLAEAARLCSDLARIKDARELNDLLARTAELLDASGIVVWIGGVGGEVLRPAFSHGYSDHTMAKMKALSSDDANAVASAYRSSRMEVVAGAGGRNGAIVTPIVTAGGCVGAMAAEVRHGAESSQGVRAVATIVAAQLATLVADSSS
jgi:hypothetical protein